MLASSNKLYTNKLHAQKFYHTYSPTKIITTHKYSHKYIHFALVPEMQTLLQSYVCPAFDACDSMFIGTEQFQLNVIANLYKLTNTYNIHYGEAYIIRALLLDNLNLALELSKAFNNYNTDITNVHELISKLPQIQNHNVI